MVARVHTVAFSGIEVLNVQVQVSLTGGLPAFTIFGLPDNAVAESRERVRAALTAIGLAMPHKRIIVDLAPAAHRPTMRNHQLDHPLSRGAAPLSE